MIHKKTLQSTRTAVVLLSVARMNQPFAYLGEAKSLLHSILYIYIFIVLAAHSRHTAMERRSKAKAREDI